MAWWVAPLLQASAYVYKGISDSNTANRQSKIDANNALANSLAINQAGAYNAKSAMAMASINAQLGVAGAVAKNQGIRAITEYNAQSKSFLSDYEASLLENEAMLVAEASKLDLKQLANSHAQAIGDIRVSQGASGAVMDQDTPALVITSAKEQQDLESFIVRRGADIQYSKLMDAAAMSRWQGAQEAQRITFEGRLLEQSNLIGASLSGFASVAQGSIDANAMVYNSQVQAYQTLNTGMQKADAEKYAGNSAFWSGMFGAGTSLAASYVDYKGKQDSYDEMKSLLRN